MPTPPLLYLASQSPRRAQLLEQIGISFELLLPLPADDAESLEVYVQGESPSQYVQRVTTLKAQAALDRLAKRGLPAAPILVSDTTVAIGGTIFGKPADEKDGFKILQSLSGKTHRVLTAIAIARVGKPIALKLSASRVCFKRLNRTQIERYIATGEPMGKAGAYAIQGQAGTLIKKIEGSYSGIMGLPLFETYELLTELKIIV
jgi:septum formation protein